jgi:EAL domain-containing protein (putative c-di-GMP-specific phosphodiesterase class I)
LDKSILDEFLKPDKISIMDNIISLAHSLGLEITAEGIENIQQYKYLRKAACDYIQGYLFSKPIEINKVDSLYEDNFLENI